ncbi:MAG: LamG domain-containing protein, partial [Desulfobacterales bacterium]|nr:LamG domain-containing protein [Desulfobacterales bacterium]
GEVNGATLTADRFGNTNQAYKINEYQFISLPYSILNGLDVFTLAFWVKLNALNSDINNIIGIANEYEDNEFNLAYVASSDRFYMDWKGSTNYRFGENNAVEDMNWHFIVFSRNGSVCTIDIDGKRVEGDIAISSDNLVIAENGFVLGQDQDTVGGGFGLSQNMFGEIDDMRIYNRILSEFEIQELYNLGNDLPPDLHCYTQADLDAVKQQTLDQCKNNPASCGIVIGVGQEISLPTISASLAINIPLIKYNTLVDSIDLWADFNYYGQTPEGLHLWKLNNFGIIDN